MFYLKFSFSDGTASRNFPLLAFRELNAEAMKLSVFLILLPSVLGFISPSVPIEAPCRISGAAMTGLAKNVTPLRMAAGTNGDKEEPWSMLKIWRDVVGSASETKAKVDATVRLCCGRHWWGNERWVGYRLYSCMSQGFTTTSTKYISMELSSFLNHTSSERVIGSCWSPNRT